MAFLSIPNVSIRGIAVCVPNHVVENRSLDYFTSEEIDNVITMTGIERRYVADENTTCSDLCEKAFNELIEKLGWEKDSIGAVVFVTQTPDYLEPATSCIIQNRLGLSTDCMTIDISLGCSGWVHALSVISALMQNGTIKRGLLLAGDTPTKNCSVNPA